MLSEKELSYLGKEFNKMVANFIKNNETDVDIDVILALLGGQLLRGLLISQKPIEDVKLFFEKILKDYYEMKDKEK